MMQDARNLVYLVGDGVRSLKLNLRPSDNRAPPPKKKEKTPEGWRVQDTRAFADPLLMREASWHAAALRRFGRAGRMIFR